MAEQEKAPLLMVIKRILRQMAVDRESIQEDMIEYAAMTVPQLESIITHLSTLVRPVAFGEGSSRDPIPGGGGTPQPVHTLLVQTQVQQTPSPSVLTQDEGTPLAQRRHRSRYALIYSSVFRCNYHETIQNES